MPSPDVSQPEQPAHELPTDTVQDESDILGNTAEDYGDAETELPVEQSTNGPVSETIAEGKQNAKAVLAATGVPLPPGESSQDASNGDGDGSQPPESPRKGANGSSSSRKRSRDGSVRGPSSPTGSLPVRTRETPLEKIQLEDYVNREFQYSAAASWPNPTTELQQQKRAERDYYLAVRRETHMNPAALYGVGYEGFGNIRTDLRNQHPQLLYPANRRRPGNRKTRELRVSRRDLKIQNDQTEDLVPIRLDIEWEKIRIRDTFTWNLHDRVVSPEIFAEKTVEDLGVPLETALPLVRMITQNIHEQLADYYPQIYIREEAIDPHLPYTAYKNDEMRILVKLNITIGQHTLIDQFEWDMNDPLNSPEEFAAHMTKDLSLSGEFATAIAHSIREQSQLFTKSLYIVSHPFDGHPIEDPDLKASFLPTPVASSFRPFQAAKEFTPYLYELNEAELERTEVSISRDQRRQKRSVNRRGGPALPDLKDRQRTIRTMVVSSVIPNSAPSVEEGNLFKRSGSGRRRAAAGQRDIGDESEESDSDDSSIGSPAIGPNQAQGTARTRGMRGAATAAHAALRANLNPSATPEPLHEPKAPPRRREYKEDSVEEQDRLIVKLRISPEKFRHFVTYGRRSVSNAPAASTPGRLPPSQQSTPQVQTPTPGSTTLPSQPVPQSRSSQGGSNSQTPAPPPQQLGAIDATHPPQPGVPGVSFLLLPLLLFSLPPSRECICANLCYPSLHLPIGSHQGWPNYSVPTLMIPSRV